MREMRNCWRFAFLTAAILAGICGARLVTSTKLQLRLIDEVESLGGHVETRNLAPSWIEKAIGRRLSRGLGRVSDVRVSAGAISDEHLILIGRQPNVIILRLDTASITDDGLRHLRSVTGREYLSIQETNISDAGLEHLDVLHDLQAIWIGSTRVSDRGVASFHLKHPKCVVHRHLTQ